MNRIIIFIFVFLFVRAPKAYSQDCILSNNGNMLLPIKKKLNEADYIKAYCNGKTEYVLPDNTRIDCLTENYVCEFDWAKKWYEGFGQTLWYSYNTGKKPCLVLILKSDKDYIYYNRAKKLSRKYDVNLIKLKSNDYKK